ncbi:hypothetical protein ACTWP5_02800 [Streptomyces sp. 4N509B]|uniref:hypothetical protein n=1 Tax=Streptomyces sp. 4N509B TaxID=3457413 RepID=UPI003FD35528
MTGSHRAPSRRLSRALPRPVSRGLSRVLVVATAGGGAVLVSAGGASAEFIPRDLGAGTLPIVTGTVEDSLATVSDATTHAVAPALGLQLNPLAGTTTDPLTNSAGTQIADFRPLSTELLTGPLSDGASLSTLPGELLNGLTGGGDGDAAGG